MIRSSCRNALVGTQGMMPGHEGDGVIAGADVCGSVCHVCRRRGECSQLLIKCSVYFGAPCAASPVLKECLSAAWLRHLTLMRRVAM